MGHTQFDSTKRLKTFQIMKEKGKRKVQFRENTRKVKERKRDKTLQQGEIITDGFVNADVLKS